MESHRLADRLQRAALPVVLVLGLVLAWWGFTACSNGDGKSGRVAPPASSGPHDPDAENPDRGQWVDLSKSPFDPDLVGGTLVVARADIVPSLNNLLMKNAGDGGAIMRYFLCPRLVQVSPDMVDGQYVVVPWAAESLPERRGDGVTYIWKLRRDLTWEDGVSVTSKDYVFTWKMLSDPAVAAGERRGDLERVRQISALDDFTLEVVFKEPYYNAVLEFGLNFTVIPAHTMPRDIDAFNAMKRHQTFGAWKVARFDSDHLLLELRHEYRSKRYPIHPSYIERVEYRKVTDRASMLAQLKQGQVSIARITNDQYESLSGDAGFKEKCWKTWYYLPGYTMICWNLWEQGDKDFSRPHPALNDRRVRTALAHLIPRERIIAELCHGRARLCDGPFFHTDSHRDPAVHPIPFDLDAARALLAEAGWKLDSKGRLMKNGVELAFDLHFPNESGVFDVPVNLLQSSARKVGIRIDLKPESWGVVGAVIRNRTFDAFCVRWAFNPPVEPDLWSQWHSAGLDTGGRNYPGLRDTEVDRLITAYRGEFSPERRAEVRRNLYRRIHELQPYAFLFSQASTVAVSRKWANVKIHDLGPRFSDFVLRRLWKKP